jgi:response regulator NasT
MKLRVLLIESDPTRSAVLRAALTEAGYSVSLLPAGTPQLAQALRRLEPGIILLDQDAPDRDTLEDVCMATRGSACPVVMFTPAHDSGFMRAAMQAGVSAYVAGEVSDARVRSVVEVALVRHEQMLTLRGELQDAKQQLAERKLVERAKGLLMQRRQCSEAEAFALLRRQAMDRNQRLAEVARQLLAMADLLT